jgi:predicted TPR repeat methyltransferase
MKKSQLTITEAQGFHQAGNIKEAKQAYLEILRSNPNEVSALHGLALLYAEEGRLDEAQNYLEKARALKPADPAFCLHLANILKAKGSFNQAIQILQDLVREYPHFSAAFNNLGTVYFAQDQLAEAAKSYQTAIDLQPNYADAYYNLALALTKLGRTEEAINVYQALLVLAANHTAARFQLGCLLMKQQHFKKALTQFESIEHEHFFAFETQTNLATCYFKLGLLNEAKRYYFKALAMMPEDKQVLFNLGIIAMQQGMVADAIKFYQQVIMLDPNSFDAHNNLGIAFLSQKKTSLALTHFYAALKLQPNNEAIRHTIKIIKGENNLSGSPPEYIQTLFDSYADHYDSHLTQTLNYNVPQRLYQMVQLSYDLSKVKWDILDLGCGTGLCGELFKSAARSLVGVDISEKMLAQAEQKNSYDEVVLSDILVFLTHQAKTYDLILAGDVVVYFGDLNALFETVAHALNREGLFAFNAEINEHENYQMTTTGRFAHRKEYIDQLIAENGYKILRYQIAKLRVENEQSVPGHLYLLQLRA